MPWLDLVDVAIFATFAGGNLCADPKTLPDQGLERKIVRKLSSHTRDGCTI
jgi:hypothetical protein